MTLKAHELTVSQEFVDQRTENAKKYNRGSRSENQHLIHLDCELVEHTMIQSGEWYEHPTWQVDAITQEGHNIDCKFVEKYWNISKQRLTNIMRQYGIIHSYYLYEWVDKPSRRPLVVGDRVSYRFLGKLNYETVMQHIASSKFDPVGFYVDARKLLNET